mgnify:CR=1 FL=1
MVECGKCPKCESENLEYGVLEPTDMSVYYPVTCKDCGFTGREWYDLNFSGFTDKNGNEVE